MSRWEVFKEFCRLKFEEIYENLSEILVGMFISSIFVFVIAAIFRETSDKSGDFWIVLGSIMASIPLLVIIFAIIGAFIKWIRDNWQLAKLNVRRKLKNESEKFE